MSFIGCDSAGAVVDRGLCRYLLPEVGDGVGLSKRSSRRRRASTSCLLGGC
jgi:hypothetical protein